MRAGLRSGQEEPHLRLEVGADSDDAPLNGHLEGEADDPADLQQGLLALRPATLKREGP